MKIASGRIMKLIILTTLFVSVSCTEAISEHLIQADRREGVSYTTNVLHGDPNYPDQQAQSSVDFKLGSTEVDSQRQPLQQIKSTINPYTTPKSIQDYQQLNPYTNPTSGYGKYQTQSYKTNQQLRQTKPQSSYYAPSYKQQPFTSYGTNQPPHQSQSFNVGYSVKFTNGGAERNKPYKAPRFESDIITGSHKEKVKKPPMQYASSSSSEEIPFYEDIKVVKKYTKAPTPTTYPKHDVFAQTHVTPKTQKHLAYLETSNKYQPHEEKMQQQSASSPWLNLSPSVEIYRSKEVDLPDKYEPSSFDHEKALGKSEGFDYTNAVDFSGLQAATKFENYEKPSQSQPQALFAAQNMKPEYTEIKPTSVPKLPIDTSLLREPILTIHKQTMDENSKQIPIHFDTTLIQEMGKQYAELFDQGGFHEPINVYDSNGASSKPNNYEKQNEAKLNYQQFNNLLTEQSRKAPIQYKYKDSDPMSAYIAQQSNQHEVKFNFPQNGIFNTKVVPKLMELSKQKPKMYMVQENVQEMNQPQTPNQFKVFSKPANNFMRHEYEKMQKVSNSGPPRQPRINPKRLVRDYSIETDLKPPPMPYKRLRRTQTKYIAM